MDHHPSLSKTAPVPYRPGTVRIVVVVVLALVLGIGGFVGGADVAFRLYPTLCPLPADAGPFSTVFEQWLNDQWWAQLWCGLITGAVLGLAPFNLLAARKGSAPQGQ